MCVTQTNVSTLTLGLEIHLFCEYTVYGRLNIFVVELAEKYLNNRNFESLTSNKNCSGGS